MTRRVRGEGTIYKRADGRWAGSAFVSTNSGNRKRIYAYGKTRAEANEKLSELLRNERRGIPTPDRTWRLDAYLDYYLREVTNVRPSTFEDYERITEVHLKPTIGHHALSRLSASHVQQMLAAKKQAGVTTRRIKAIRDFLRSVLSHAEREELIFRNVAKLVKIEPYMPDSNEPWTPAEVMRFLEASKGHRWHGVYILTLLYGMRRGEAIGLTWDNVNLNNGSFWVKQQLQAVRSELRLGPVKTKAGNRPLPIIGLLRDVLHALPRHDSAKSWNLVFTSSTGTPITPRNVGREFQQIAQTVGLRRIKLHDGRHTSATTLKNVGVPDRDIQKILGHAHVSTTQQLYQHGDLAGQREGMKKLERVVLNAGAAVKSGVNSDFSTDQGTNIPALTSGTPGRTRTYDTWFRSLANSIDDTTLTSIIQQYQPQAYKRLLGCAAVRNCCQDSPSREIHNPREVLLFLRRLQRVQYEKLSRRSFPFNLLDTAA